MNKKYFVERYGPIFNTITFKETREAWDLLSKEEQNSLRQSFRRAKLKETYEKSPPKGRKQTEEERQKRSNSLKEFHKTHKVEKSAESIEKQRKSLKQYFSDEKNRHKQSERLKKAYRDNPNLKKQISDSLKKYWGTFRETPQGQKAIESFIKAPRGKGTSDLEKSVQDFIKQIAPDTIFNDRKILKGKELDIYVPSKKVAIEIDGLVWHCSKFKEDYTVQLSKKTDMCNELGIRLMHFYDDEVRDHFDVVKSIIASALGIYDKKIYARKCILKEISSKEGNEFFIKNHISGTAKADKYYGLFFNEELVQAISLGKNRFSKSEVPELIRMATKLNWQVVGGFSKLMSKVPCCESYVNLRIYNGNGYISSGWTVIGKTKNGYFYTDFSNRYPRQMFMKCKLEKLFGTIDKSKTEEEICKENGFYQIYDCGNLKVRWDL